MFTRKHHSGSDAVIKHEQDGWHLTVHVRELDCQSWTLDCYLLPNLGSAKRIADRQLFKYGHSCNQRCTRWEVRREVIPVAPRRSTLQRLHDDGTEAVLKQTAGGWRVQIDIKKPDQSPVKVGFQRPTLELAQSFADNEIYYFGHICNGACQDWQQV